MWTFMSLHHAAGHGDCGGAPLPAAQTGAVSGAGIDSASLGRAFTVTP
jgi:hypothetical protein